MKRSPEVLQTICSANDRRIDILMAERINREVALKTFVLNQYEMFTTCAGIVLSARGIRHMVFREFGETFAADPRTAKEQIIVIRRRLIQSYPHWVPNYLHLAIRLSSMPVAYRDEAKTAFETGFVFVKDMIIDCDHYAQLFLDAIYNPLSKSEPWMLTNQMPWFLPQRFLEAGKKYWPAEFDANAITQRLKIEAWK